MLREDWIESLNFHADKRKSITLNYKDCYVLAKLLEVGE